MATGCFQWSWDMIYVIMIATLDGRPAMRGREWARVLGRLGMRVLIVEQDQRLSQRWRDHMVQFADDIFMASDQSAAVNVLRHHDVDVIVLDLDLTCGSPLAIADFASYRCPAARVVLVTSGRAFSDGSIFRHCPNACAFLPAATDPADLALLVEYQGRAA